MMKLLSNMKGIELITQNESNRLVSDDQINNWNAKPNYIAGDNITIADGVISASGGGGGEEAVSYGATYVCSGIADDIGLNDLIAALNRKTSVGDFSENYDTVKIKIIGDFAVSEPDMYSNSYIDTAGAPGAGTLVLDFTECAIIQDAVPITSAFINIRSQHKCVVKGLTLRVDTLNAPLILITGSSGAEHKYKLIDCTLISSDMVSDALIIDAGASIDIIDSELRSFGSGYIISTASMYGPGSSYNQNIIRVIDSQISGQYGSNCMYISSYLDVTGTIIYGDVELVYDYNDVRFRFYNSTITGKIDSASPGDMMLLILECNKFMVPTSIGENLSTIINMYILGNQFVQGFPLEYMGPDLKSLIDGRVYMPEFANRFRL